MYRTQPPAFLTRTAHGLSRRVSQFMLFILLLNIFANAALSATSPSLQDVLENDFLSGTQSYIICTPQGLKRITLNEHGIPVSGNDESKSEHCIYCLPYHKLAIGYSAAEITPPVTDLIAAKPAYNDARYLLDMPLNTACPPRAPPQI